ncbi:phospholipase D [Scheffersomyces stipitis CBS 6054]|uniref:Phospholipase D1 n=1 Tax=Scheffersomyces stipitis (strain ATCC 58785 / CBS 6054 / NBRC 10063 / NRRL Y-11545) TaxID=322104 RepID=A3GHN8_PICST|nr:phospholipase D [Scheffersomyces stipitis CBS 6054]EAZ63080.2 phospholipase D [Scheffersomyces stipitis CBS 6054]
MPESVTSQPRPAPTVDRSPTSGFKRISIPRFSRHDPNGKEVDIHEHPETSNENNNFPNLQNGSVSPLREVTDVEQIYDAVSLHSEQKTPSTTRRPSFFGQESPKVITNPWNFIFKNVDKDEQRYETEEQEAKDKVPYEPHNPEDETVESPEFLDARHHSQSFSNFIPSMFSGKHERDANTNLQAAGSPENDFQVTEELKRQQTFMKKFSIFNRRRNKDSSRKQSIAAADLAEPLLEDPDKPTGERASKLIGSLAMGAPAINLLASCLLEDEHGISRAPLVLTLIGLKVTDISAGISTRIRKFKIELEYGLGPQRLKWSVDKTAKDLLYLHSKFKFERWRNEVVRNKNSELPKCPIPPIRGADLNRGRRRKSLPSNALHNQELHRVSVGEELGNVVRARSENDEDNNSISSTHSFRDHLTRLRSHLSLSSASTHDQSPEQIRTRIQKNQDYIRDVEKYLNSMIEMYALKPQSNRLFHFFEISPISSLLSYETGYSGKQGIVHVGGSTKSQGWRVGHFRANDLKGMIDRRSEKWLLVRNSYVMYVSDINSTLPLEVFLVDSKFKISYKRDVEQSREDEESDYDDSSIIQKQIADNDIKDAARSVFNQLKITLENSERKLQINPKSQKEQKLWIKSLTEMKISTDWSQTHRFGSFAPVRENCYAQWFVDGRDYFWAVSSALEMAKDVIFIHDWWLSPEIYLRRPANGNQQWRLDRILQRKAQQGVKIFVIVYRNVGSTVSTDSLYSKHSILSLNEENIHVIRSPNQLLQNTYFWAHHEKLCIIDQTVAFVGGIDLCYGRYDTPDHVLVDDSDINFQTLSSDDRPTAEEFIKFQTFPGKDYSNPRVKDFFGLERPYESMYDRNVVPRMPWHDVHMVTSGKVARDLARHFVQRWNYLLRQKRPSRFTPLLTPPPDMSDEEAKVMGLDGTCEVQLLRSACNWSLGIKEHEQSIQNAYLKLIETSEHFIYIENQFFVTSCIIEGTEIENRIGDAIVDRIIRAYKEKKVWKAIIVIPLMPGFESQVDEPDGSSVRVIMQCQYLSISRGLYSIFSKLRKFGVDPDNYIQFFSLRKWGRIGPDRTLVTEQLYIHAKTMIVDDRAVIIGSANINERSMRGIRDSEVAAIVRDKETVRTHMNGEPYLACRFAHTLRMRLMREHLGIDVDILDIVERRFKRFEEYARTQEGIQSATSVFRKSENIVLSAMVEIASRDILDQPEGTFRWKNFQKSKKVDGEPDVIAQNLSCQEDNDTEKPSPLALPISFNNRTGPHEANKGIRDKKKHSYDTRVQNNEFHKQDVYGDGLDKYRSKLAKRARLNSSRFLKEKATQYMHENPLMTYLPDVESVHEFLECDDYDMIEEMDETSEEVISTRNRERWQLLKKLSYMQRVAAREMKEDDEERKKRVNAGLSAGIGGKSPGNEGSPVSFSDKNSSPEAVANNNGSNTNHGDLNGTTLDNVSLPSVERKHEGMNEMVTEIPIITLSEQEAQDIIQSLAPAGDREFNKFLDPYGFEDPLDVEFYEDIWFEYARRNTEIYRMTFHTQPDDTVDTWKDYKQFSKLQKAFVVSQQQEAKFRKQHRGRKEEESESESESEDESEGFQYRPTMAHRPSQATINVRKFNQVGLLGNAPPSADGVVPNEVKSSPSSAHKLRLRRRMNKTTIQEDDEENGGDNDETEAILVFPNDEEAANDEKEYEAVVESSDASPEASSTPVLNGTAASGAPVRRKRRRAGTFSARRRAYMGERIFDRDSAERLLLEVQGNLVLFPTEWLSRELDGGNWFYNTDRLPPIDIYD